jgi:capsule polysaccharide export protein KpsE/RkpR
MLPAMIHPTPAGLLLIRLRWRLVVLLGLAGTMAATAYYAWSPRWYQAELMIVPKRSPSDSLPAANLLNNLPLDLSAASPFGQSDADRIAAVMESRSVTDAVIAKFDLVQRYHADRIERTRKVVWGHCATTVEKKPNLVRLTCEDTEPAVARDLANAIGQLADAAFRRIAVSSATEERAFLEKRVEEARRTMETSSAKLRQFQELHKVIDLPEQGKAVVSGMAALEGDLISKRLELSYARGFAANDEASVAQLRRQIAILSGELQSLEGQRPGAPNAGRAPRSGSELFPRAMEIPALGAELETLIREHKIDETVFLMLTQRYEARKLDEARNLSTFVVVDDAALPTYRIRPTLRVVAVGMLAGLALGLLLVLLPAWWSDLRRRAAVEGQSGPA